jgi:hypothetical protein
MGEKKEPVMTQTEKVKVLMALCKHSISRSTIERRLRNGWSDEKIINTSPQRKPPKDHPLKSPCYQKIAARKGWKIDT